MALTMRCYCISFSFTFLFLSGNYAAATAVGLCRDSDYPNLCAKVIKGTTDPTIATKLAINALISEVKHVRKVSKTLGKSPELDVCNDQLDDAIDNLSESLQLLKKHDKPGLNSYLSAVVTDFSTCDDACSESGKTSPLAKPSQTANQMASNCLALASHIQ